MKFPVNFPVSREFASGDGFDYDCVRHQLKQSVSRYRSLSEIAQVTIQVTAEGLRLLSFEKIRPRCAPAPERPPEPDGVQPVPVICGAISDVRLMTGNHCLSVVDRSGSARVRR